MHPVGSRIDIDGTRKQYTASSAVSERALLEGSVMAAAQLASTSVPGVLRVIQDVEDDAALLLIHGMKGDGKFSRVLHSMDVSVDLSNATHPNNTYRFHIQRFGNQVNPWRPYQLGRESNQAWHFNDGQKGGLSCLWNVF